MARYVGFKIGKVHEEHVFSEYYCGGCGFPVTDHDSFCPECGGAFRESDADDDENAKLRDVESESASLRGAAQGLGELCDRYKDENEKLRDAVAILWECCACQTDSFWCDGCDYHDEDNGGCKVEKVLHELGIEAK